MVFITPEVSNKKLSSDPFVGARILNETYIACLVIATIYLAMGFFEGFLLLCEGLVIGAIAIVLANETSRAAALLLIAIYAISLCNGIASWLGVVDMGDRNLILAGIGIWCGFRAWKATVLIKGIPTFDDALKRLIP